MLLPYKGLLHFLGSINQHYKSAQHNMTKYKTNKSLLQTHMAILVLSWNIVFNIIYISYLDYNLFVHICCVVYPKANTNETKTQCFILHPECFPHWLLWIQTRVQLLVVGGFILLAQSRPVLVLSFFQQSSSTQLHVESCFKCSLLCRVGEIPATRCPFTERGLCHPGKMISWRQKVIKVRRLSHRITVLPDY